MIPLLLAAGPGIKDVPLFPYPNSRNIIVDSVRIHYRMWEPAGIPKGKVFLVHGFSGSTWNFRKNIDTLVQAGYKVVAADLPGFGYSERNDRINQSQSNRSRLLWLMLDSLDKGDTSGWNIVGHSMGGGTVEAMGIMKPERTRTVTIIDGMLLSKGSAFYMSFFSLNNNRYRNKVLKNITEHKFINYNNVEKRLKNVYGFDPDSALVMAYLTPLEIPGTSGTVVNLIANADEIATLNREVLNAMPVLLVWGKKDRTIKLSNGKRFLRTVHDAELEVIPNAYHSPMETESETFNKILLRFLNSNNKQLINSSIP
jgi:pimeloyl-ACP methyl ester carboxylesterase